MKCKQMDIICNMFNGLSPKQSVIAIDILRILYNKRKQGMNIIELNRYFKNRYIHFVRNTLGWLKDMGYVTQLNSDGCGTRYIITLAGVKKHWEIWNKICRKLCTYIV